MDLICHFKVWGLKNYVQSDSTFSLSKENVFLVVQPAWNILNTSLKFSGPTRAL